MYRTLLLLIATALLALSALPPMTTAAETVANRCPPNPRGRVPHPNRHRIITPCVTVTGTMVRVEHDEDGGWDFGLMPDEEWRGLANDKNRAELAGVLVATIFPTDEARLTVPRVGYRVKVTGAHVTDLAWGWNEITPV